MVRASTSRSAIIGTVACACRRTMDSSECKLLTRPSLFLLCSEPLRFLQQPSTPASCYELTSRELRSASACFAIPPENDRVNGFDSRSFMGLLERSSREMDGTINEKERKTNEKRFQRQLHIFSNAATAKEAKRFAIEEKSDRTSAFLSNPLPPLPLLPYQCEDLEELKIRPICKAIPPEIGLILNTPSPPVCLS